MSTPLTDEIDRLRAKLEAIGKTAADNFRAAVDNQERAEAAERQLAEATQRLERISDAHVAACAQLAEERTRIKGYKAEQAENIRVAFELQAQLNKERTARALLEPLRRDAERLDWWQQFIDAAEQGLGTKCGVYVTENGEVQIGELQRWWSTNIRSAIDAAIAAGGKT